MLQVQRARPAALLPCEVPCLQDISILEAIDIDRAPAVLVPWRVKVMAQGGEWLGSCIFRLGFDDRSEYFKCSRAAQLPVKLFECRLQIEDVMEAYVDPATCWVEVDTMGEPLFSLLAFHSFFIAAVYVVRDHPSGVSETWPYLRRTC